MADGHGPAIRDNEDPPTTAMGKVQSMKEKAKKQIAGARKKVGLRDRIACYQWTFFTSTMATGGCANVLYSRKFSCLNVMYGLVVLNPLAYLQWHAQYHTDQDGWTYWVWLSSFSICACSPPIAYVLL